METPTRTIVYYHANCPDGFGAAYSAWKKFGDTAEYIPLERGHDIPTDFAGAHVFFVDFSYPQEIMDMFVKEAASVTVLDHHIGLRDVVESMPEHVFDNDRSGTTIAWDYFHPGVPRPRLMEYLQDDDLFTYKLPETRAVMAYVSVQPYTFEFWDTMMAELENDVTREKFLEKTQIYGEYFVLLAELAASKAKLVTFEGYECYFATAHPTKPMKSLVGNMLAKKHGPFALVVSAHPRGFGVSIRGDGTVDVSLIAQKYGGNGHKNSSGFAIPVDGPMPWTIVEDDEDTGN
ncbi:MAG: hypothetical protein JWN49_571 [Parcubacteria group bacterium]|nr:hypothetical protein [Parcubacteria group bacterium]